MILNQRTSTLIVLALLIVAVVASGGSPLLNPRVDVALGPDGCGAVGFDCSNDPQGLALADFNGDGRLDAVTANNGSDDATILLNDGSGALAASSTLTAGSGPTGVATTDFDGDDNVDLAVVNGSDSNVSIFLGNGDGTFASPSTVDVGLFPESVVASDFNEDGDADFATSDLFNDTVTVRLGNGDGTFAAAIFVDVSPGPNGLAVGDFDQDGTPDLVVTLDDAFPGEVAILLGDGTGDFVVQSPSLIVGDSPLSVAVGDLDGDQIQDLAVPNWGEDTVSVFFGNGDGTFDEGPVLDAGLVPEDVKIADLDGDGIADIITLDGFGSEDADGLLVVIPGVGDGTFDQVELFDLGAGPSAVAVGDLNGDGPLDVVTTHFDSDDLAYTLNRGAAGGCVGDCDGDGEVAINELIRGVNINLGNAEVSTCTAMDGNQDGEVAINELIQAVNNSLNGCGA